MIALNRITRYRLSRSAYRNALCFGRGRSFATLCALCMALSGRTPRYRILNIKVRKSDPR